MSIPDDNPHHPHPPPPRSPKRAQHEPDELMEPASKRSRAASPWDDDEEARTKATTAAMANASLTAGEGRTDRQAGDGAQAGGDESTQQQASTATSTDTAQPPSQAAAAESNEGTEPPKTKICGVCNEKEGKYKCARCALPFCSVPCNKIHRENHPPDPEPTAKPPITTSATTPQHPTNASNNPRDPKNPFSVLDDSDQLRYLFKRYPGLQTRLLDVIAATEPPPEMQSTGSSLNDMMKARAMAAANPKKEQWTHDVGIRNGKEALRKARNADGEEGEGVREYIELINHLMSQASQNAEAEEIVRKQAAEKDTELIRRLMTEDRG